MKKLMILCFSLTFILGFADQKYEKVTTKTPDPLSQEMHQAKKAGDKATYQRLLEQYKNLRTGEDESQRSVVTVDDGYAGGPAFRYGGDFMIYSGLVNTDLWSMAGDLPDEAISVDYFRGDTLVAGVASGEGLIWLLKSVNKGATWYTVYGWSIAPDSFVEPEVFYSPEGGYIHLMCRSTGGNGNLVCLTVDMSDSSWYQSWPQSTADTVRNYSVCLDREGYDDNNYYIYLVWHYGKGQTNDGVIFRRSQDNGVSWTAVDTVLWASAGYPDIVYGDNDNLFLSFLGRAGGDYDIGFFISTDYGDSWGGENIIDGGTEVKRQAQIAAAYDGSGYGWVVYPRKQTNNYGLRWSQTTNSGTNWSSPAYFFDVADTSEILPSISVYDGFNSNEAVPYITFQRWFYDYTGNGSIYTGYWTGSDWALLGTYNDTLPVATRSIQTWEAPGVPAFAYVGHNSQNVYFDSWNNIGVNEDKQDIVDNVIDARVKPNPFTRSTNIEYSQPVSGQVKIKAYNTLGQEVATIFEANQPSGDHRLLWDGADNYGRRLPNGVYLLKIEAENIEAMKKVIIE